MFIYIQKFCYHLEKFLTLTFRLHLQKMLKNTALGKYFYSILQYTEFPKTQSIRLGCPLVSSRVSTQLIRTKSHQKSHQIIGQRPKPEVGLPNFLTFLPKLQFCQKRTRILTNIRQIYGMFYTLFIAYKSAVNQLCTYSHPPNIPQLAIFVYFSTFSSNNCVSPPNNST